MINKHTEQSYGMTETIRISMLMMKKIYFLVKVQKKEFSESREEECFQKKVDIYKKEIDTSVPCGSYSRMAGRDV